MDVFDSAVEDLEGGCAGSLDGVGSALRVGYTPAEGGAREEGS